MAADRVFGNEELFLDSFVREAGDDAVEDLLFTFSEGIKKRREERGEMAGKGVEETVDVVRMSASQLGEEGLNRSSFIHEGVDDAAFIGQVYGRLQTL